jgi:hypothetical protein
MQRITLKSAIETLQSRPDTPAMIVTRPRGYAVCIAGDIIRSQRENELTFLTYDGAINYVRRHLAPQLDRPLPIVIAPAPDEH